MGLGAPLGTGGPVAMAAAEPTETEEIDTEASSEGASDSAGGPDEAEDEADGDAEEEDD